MSDGVGDFIRVQRQLGHLSLRRLAELSDVSNAYLSQVERGLYTPSAQVMKNIAHALDLSAEALYSRAGLLDDETKADTGGVEEAIRLDDELSAEAKETLLRVYQSLRSTA